LRLEQKKTIVRCLDGQRKKNKKHFREENGNNQHFLSVSKEKQNKNIKNS